MPPDPLFERFSEATLALVDDDPAFRAALVRRLELEGLRVEAFASGDELLERPDLSELGCCILDWVLPGLSGLEVQRELLHRAAGLPVIILTAYGTIPRSVEAMRYGAVTFLHKRGDENGLFEAIEEALKLRLQRGQHAVNRRQARMLVRDLSFREREILCALVQGQIYKQIAETLGISERTVKAHRAQLITKFAGRNNADLIRIALSAEICGGLLPPPDESD